jgi:hypothetical protein
MSAPLRRVGTLAKRIADRWRRNKAAILRGLLAVVTVASLTGAVVIFIFAWLAPGAAPSLEGKHKNAEESSPLLVGEVICKQESMPTVLVTATAFDPHARRVTVQLEICASTDALLHLRDVRGRHLVTRSAHEPETLVVAREASRAKLVVVGLQLPLISIVFLQAIETPGLEAFVSLARLVKNPGQAIPLKTQALPVEGSSARYPFDAYTGREFLYAETVGIVRPGTRHEETGAGVAEDIQFQLFYGPSIAPFTLDGSQVAEEGFAEFELGLHRTVLTQSYVTALSFLPLILALLLWIVIAQRSQQAQQLGPEALAGVGAVLIAILPLRQVLVPEETGMLTLVDYWLGLQVAVLIAIACWAVRRTITGGSPGGPS